MVELRDERQANFDFGTFALAGPVDRDFGDNTQRVVCQITAAVINSHLLHLARCLGSINRMSVHYVRVNVNW